MRRLAFAGAALVISLAFFPWLLSGGLGHALLSGRTEVPGSLPHFPDSVDVLGMRVHGPLVGLLLSPFAVVWWLASVPLHAIGFVWGAVPVLRAATLLVLCAGGALVVVRARARNRRVYRRYRVVPYRSDSADPAEVARFIGALHKRLLPRYWRRVLQGQVSAALEVRVAREPETGVRTAYLTVTCPTELESAMRSAVRGFWRHSTIVPEERTIKSGSGCIVRLKKGESFVKPITVGDGTQGDDAVTMDRIITTLHGTDASALVQIALTPAPASFGRYARWLRARSTPQNGTSERDGDVPLWHGRQQGHSTEGGRHDALFFTDIRILGPSRAVCEEAGKDLRQGGASNALVERGTTIRQGRFGLYARRIARGEGNPLPSFRRGVFSAREIAELWHLPSVGFSAVPFERSNVPHMVAPPGIARPRRGRGLGRDANGPITIEPSALSQNTKIVGTVNQGKTSVLLGGFEEDLRLGGAAILFDPKGDAAEAALGLIPRDRRVTYLDLTRPIVGFNPLWVPGVAADTIADYVVEAMKNLFDEGDIKASSDRYLRNAIIAVHYFEPERATLWDVAKILSVSPQGREYRKVVGERLAHLAEVKEISEFFRSELSTQLEEAASATVAKLDAPANKLARFINSPGMKRVLQRSDEVLDLDRVIRNGDVLIIKGALGTLGPGNTRVSMQLLLGMLDAALSRQQDLVAEEERVGVRLSVDEASLVFTRSWAATMAHKRSAGLCTRAAWQTDSQWIDPHLRAQLDALFGHHIWANTASPEDARNAITVMMPEYTDMLRLNESAGARQSPRPDVIVSQPPHQFLASFTGSKGRLAAFGFESHPFKLDRAAVTDQLRTQWRRVARPLPFDDWLSAETAERTRAEDWVDWTAGDEDEAVVLASGAAAAAATSPGRASASTSGVGDDPPSAASEADADATSTAADGAPAAQPEPRPEAEPALSPVGDPPDPAADVVDAPVSAAGRANRATPATLLELVQLEMTVSVARATPAQLPTDREAAVLAGISTAPDKTMTREDVRAAWFSHRSVEQAAAALAPAIERGWLRELAIRTPEGARIDGYAVTREGRRALTNSRTVARRLSREELEILAWLAETRYAFGTQIGRRWFPRASDNTLQRRLRKLFDAGLLQRFQFKYRRGGSPACYAVTAKAIAIAQESVGPHGNYLEPTRRLEAPESKDPAATQVRHDLHVSGWLLALEAALDGRITNVRGPHSAYVLPPQRRVRSEWIALGPDDIQLPGGAFLHSVKTTNAAGEPVDVERFKSVKPDAAFEAHLRRAGSPRREILVEVDMTERASKNRGKFERYDQFLTGWADQLDRYGKHLGIPIVVFVCPTEAATLQFLALADETMLARRAMPGEPAETWGYPSRENVLFVTEEAVHHGSLDGYRLPALPPDVRAELASGGHKERIAARECKPRATSLREVLAQRVDEPLQLPLARAV